MRNIIKDYVGRVVNKHNLKELSSDANNWKNDSKKADKAVKYCNGCKKCWEFWTEQRGPKRGRTKMLYIYADFPAYGKEKVLCPMCKN